MYPKATCLRQTFLLLSLVLYLMVAVTQIKADCDQTFVSRGGPTNGTFNAPELYNPFNLSRQCLYTFLAGPGERVQLTFKNFDLRGSPPDGAAVGEIPACGHEYMDVYSEVVSLEPTELVNSPFGGRFCGPIPPRTRVSLNRALALAFFTNKPEVSNTLFTGTYQFINASDFEIGTPVPNTVCSFTIHSSKRKTGVLLSPTYPGTYPKDITCNYQFIGQPGQRVRLEFRDFDLFFGGPHCPLDWVRIYDGADNSSAMVGLYCGQQRNLVLYSSDHRILVTFFTLPRTANTQNRGFKGIFEFSESFVKLDFISKNDSEHIRGSECDQKILSKKKSSGYVYSPNYPFPYIPKIVCRYFIYGMQDSQNLEKVRLEFIKFEIPKGQTPKPDSACSDGYLKIYLRGQEATDSYDKFDAELCGESSQEALISDGPRLVMVFSSGELQGRGFKAKYTFETEYKVPGTAAPDGGCSFTYRSSARKSGEFNSPRNPANYPNNIDCTYTLLATPNEQVSLVFDSFKTKAPSWNATPGTYGGATCQEDWVESWWLGRNGTKLPVGKWCGVGVPGPMQSPRGTHGLELRLHSDHKGVASGFKARYVFEVAKSIFGECGGNISGSSWGTLWSPGWPKAYEGPARGQAFKACNWFINVKPNKRILINFPQFAIEGHITERGCSSAVVRIWLEGFEPPVELCGEKSSDQHWQFISALNSMKLSFIISDKSVGSPGWKAVWTEVDVVDEGSDCLENGGRCSVSGRIACLPPSASCSSLSHCAMIKPVAQEVTCNVEGASLSQWENTGWSSVWWVICSGLAAMTAVTYIAIYVKRQQRRRSGPRIPPPPPRPPPRPRAPAMTPSPPPEALTV